MEKLKVGFAGKIKSGKGTATKYLKVWYPGTPSKRFSDPLREFRSWFDDVKNVGIFGALDFEETKQYLAKTLPYFFSADVFKDVSSSQLDDFAAWIVNDWLAYPGEVKESRHNLQSLSTALRSIFAENILERTIIARIKEAKTKSPLAIIEGIRRVVDIGTLLKTPEFRLVYIVVNPVVAYQRMIEQNENTGDRETAFERFMELCNAETEQEIHLLKPHAHLVIDNSGPPEVMERMLRTEVAKWLKS